MDAAQCPTGSDLLTRRPIRRDLDARFTPRSSSYIYIWCLCLHHYTTLSLCSVEPVCDIHPASVCPFQELCQRHGEQHPQPSGTLPRLGRRQPESSYVAHKCDSRGAANGIEDIIVQERCWVGRSRRTNLEEQWDCAHLLLDQRCSVCNGSTKGLLERSLVTDLDKIGSVTLVCASTGARMWRA